MGIHFPPSSREGSSPRDGSYCLQPGERLSWEQEIPETDLPASSPVSAFSEHKNISWSVAELSRPTLAAPVMLSELPDTAPVDVSVAPATVPVAVSAAQETAPEASTPVVNTSVQFTSLHSSWLQPTLPCAVSPSSVAEPVRASESASRSVTETDSPLKAEALICMLYRSSVPADCCTSPGIEPPVQLCDSASAALTYITKLEAVPSLYRQPKE